MVVVPMQSGCGAFLYFMLEQSPMSRSTGLLVGDWALLLSIMLTFYWIIGSHVSSTHPSAWLPELPSARMVTDQPTNFQPTSDFRQHRTTHSMLTHSFIALNALTTSLLCGNAPLRARVYRVSTSPSQVRRKKTVLLALRNYAEPMHVSTLAQRREAKSCE